MKLKILLEDITELSTTKKEPIGQGSHHSVYKSLNDPNKIFKVIDDADNSWIELFKKFPSLFAKVYRHNDKGAEVEKLNVKKAQYDFDDLDHVLNSDDGYGFWQLLFDIAEGKNKQGEMVRKYHDYLKDNQPTLVTPFMKFVKLISDIRKQTGLNGVDVHGGNFGYDKSGKLKMIDI